MTDYIPTTELEAVNTLLETIGEAPVASLQVSGLADAATAKSTLHSTSRAVQSAGWQFNTETEYPLVPNASNELKPPSNTLKIYPSLVNPELNVAYRGGRLYDRRNHTFSFTQTYKFELTLFLPFEDLPETARYYITIAAARKFQKHILGSDTIDKFTAVDEMQARALLDEAEGVTANHSIFDAWDVARTLDR